MIGRRVVDTAGIVFYQYELNGVFSFGKRGRNADREGQQRDVKAREVGLLFATNFHSHSAVGIEQLEFGIASTLQSALVSDVEVHFFFGSGLDARH